MADDDRVEPTYKAYRQMHPREAIRTEVRERMRAIRTERALQKLEAQPTASGTPAPPTPGEAVSEGIANTASMVSVAFDALPEAGGVIAQAAVDLPIRTLLGGVLDVAPDLVGLGEDVLDATLPLVGLGGLVPPPDQRDAASKELQGAVERVAPQPEMIGNQVARGFVAWALPFRKFTKPAKALMGKMGAAEGGKAAQIGADAIAGFMADFATVDEGLSSLLEAHPQYRNDITEFIEMIEQGRDGDAGELEQRMRRGGLGSALGIATDLVFTGLRAVARGRRVKAEAARKGVDLKKLVDEMDIPAEKLRLSASNKLTFKAKRQTMAATDPERAVRNLEETAAAINKKFGGKVFNPAELRAVAADLDAFEPDVPWEKIADGTLPMADLISDYAKIFSGRLTAARRGKIKNTEARSLAEKLGVNVDDVLSRKTGEALNVEEMLAFNGVLDAATKKLEELAHGAMYGGTAEAYNFNRMLAIHGAVLEQVLGARAEAGRTLQIWNNPMMAGSINTGRQVQALLDASGGLEHSQRFARKMTAMWQSGTPEAGINNMLRMGQHNRAQAFKAAFKEYYTMNLLWSPTTHIVNVATPVLTAANAVLERAVAREIGVFTGSEAVKAGESIALARGLARAAQDLTVLAYRSAWKEGGGFSPLTAGGRFRRAVTDERTSLGLASSNKIDDETARITSSRLGFNPETSLGRTIDYYGKVARIPGAALGFEDDISKILLYRAEMEAQLTRQYSDFIQANPNASNSERMLWVDNFLKDPAADARIDAQDFALENSFTKPLMTSQQLEAAGGYGAAIGETAAKLANFPIIGPMLIPFNKTPMNILRYNFERMGPVAFLSGQFRRDLRAGGATRDLALAKLATGSMLVLAAADLATQGVVTGTGVQAQGDREALQRMGWMENSFRIMGKYVSHNRLDVGSSVISTAATLHEILSTVELDPGDEPEIEEIYAAMMAVVGSVAMHKTWMQGIGATVDMLRQFGRGSDNVLLKTGQKFGGPMIPFFTAIEALNRTVSKGEIDDMNDKFDFITTRARLFAADKVKKRNLYGERISYASQYGALFDNTVPMRVKQFEDDPVEREMALRGMNIRRIRKKGAEIGGVEIDFYKFPRIYEALVQVAGGGDIDEGIEPIRADIAGRSLTMKEALRETVSRPEYQAIPTNQLRRQVLQGIIDGYRAAAKGEILQGKQFDNKPEFERFRKFIREERDKDIAELRGEPTSTEPRRGIGGGITVPR